MENNAWVDNETIALFPYDAGSDDGPSYTSANDESIPHVPIALINTSPFAMGVPVGTLTFVKEP